MAKVIDPNAPKPEGELVTPARGEFSPEFQQQNSSTPRSIDSVLQKHAQTQPKSIAISVLDQNSKFSANLTYGKTFFRHFFSRNERKNFARKSDETPENVAKCHY